MSVGKKIKELRGNLTLAEFGELFGVGASNISGIELEKSKPSHDLALKICDHFGCTLDWLFRDIGTYGENISNRHEEKTTSIIYADNELEKKYLRLLEENNELYKKLNKEQTKEIQELQTAHNRG